MALTISNQRAPDPHHSVGRHCHPLLTSVGDGRVLPSMVWRHFTGLDIPEQIRAGEDTDNEAMLNANCVTDERFAALGVYRSA
jgi:hypothetical protein